MFDCIFYVILELCMMCVGVILYSCIGWLVFGVNDYKIGVIGFCFYLFEDFKMNYLFEIWGGLFWERCS